jgi:hypothetical protein
MPTLLPFIKLTKSYLNENMIWVQNVSFDEFTTILKQFCKIQKILGDINEKPENFAQF